jgi:phosphatidylserine/phosphatidylglycerophosphate/cardiolipin synthase-like enzyme
MHHKFSIFDSKTLLTGSYNWTRSAERANQENIILTDEPRLVSSFQGCFDRLWRQFEG